MDKYINSSPAATRMQSSLKHSDSDPTLNKSSDTDNNITAKRIKRKFEQCDESDSSKILDGMRKMLSSFCEDQDKKFASIQESICEIKKQNSDFYNTVQFLTQEYDHIKSRMNKYEAERKEHLSSIKNLESRIDFMEKKSLSTTIEIRNIPKLKPEESKSDLQELVTKVASTLSVKVDRSDFVDIYRQQTNSKAQQTNPVILVNFSNVSAK